MAKTATLHLICGLPGSGKTTLARKLEAKEQVVRLCPDEWIAVLGGDFNDEALRDKVEALQWRLAQRLLSVGTNVALECGFWSREERMRFRATATELGAVTCLHFLDVPLAELKQRLAVRNAQADPDTPWVNLDDLDHWATLFERPTEDEL